MVLRASVFVAFAVMLCTANCKVAFMLNFLQSRAANKTRLERDPTSFERDPGTPNTLTYPQIGQANQAKQSKPSSMCTIDQSSPKAMLFSLNPSNPETQIKNLEDVVI